MNLTKEELNRMRDVSIHVILGVQNTGRRIMMRCPFHQERTPSFVLYPENTYNCFGCGKNGRGAIDFCKDLGYSFIDSLVELVKYV